MQTIPATYLKELAPEQLTENRLVNACRWLFIAILLLFAGNTLYNWMDPFSTFSLTPLAYQFIQATWVVAMLVCAVQLLRSKASGWVLAIILAVHLCGCYVGESWLEHGCMWDGYNVETPVIAVGLLITILCSLVIFLRHRSMAFFTIKHDIRMWLILGAVVVMALDQVFTIMLPVNGCHNYWQPCY